jgi:hypothetical protein
MLTPVGSAGKENEVNENFWIAIYRFTCMNLADIVTRDLDLFFLPFSLKHQTLIPSPRNISMLFFSI